MDPDGFDDGFPIRSPKIKSGDVSRSSSPSVNASGSASIPVSVRQQMARFKQMEQPSPSGSTDGEQTMSPMTPGSSALTFSGRKKVPKVHKRNGRGETPLHVAAKKGELALCEQLIAEGAEINQSDNAGWTPLHEATSNNHFEVVQTLLRNGANPNAKSVYGDSPLHDAVHCNYTRLVWTLVKYGAVIDDRCREDPRASEITRSLLLDPLPAECPQSEPEGEPEDNEEGDTHHPSGSSSRSAALAQEEEEAAARAEKEKKKERKKRKREEKEREKERARLLQSSTPSPSARRGRPPGRKSSATPSAHEASLMDASASAASASATHHHQQHHHHHGGLSVDTVESEDAAKRREEESRTVPATTPISVIVEDKEKEEGECDEDEDAEDASARGKAAPAPSTPLLVIAGGDSDDFDDENKLTIDEGDEEDSEGHRGGGVTSSLSMAPPTLTSRLHPPKERSREPGSAKPSPIGGGASGTATTVAGEELMEDGEVREEEEEEVESGGGVTAGRGRGRQDQSQSRPSGGYAEDAQGSSGGTTTTQKKRKKAGPAKEKKSGGGGSSTSMKRGGVGVWGTASVKGTKADTASSSAAAATDDPYEFRVSSPDSASSRGVTVDRELSAPPSAKRPRATVSPSPTPDPEHDEEDEEDTRMSSASGNKKVPPLRIMLPKTSEEREQPPSGVDHTPAGPSSSSGSLATPQSSQSSTSSVSRQRSRGRPGGRRGGGVVEDETSAQRMTRSKVRQSGRGLDDSEGGGRRKGRRSAGGALAAVAEDDEMQGDEDMDADEGSGGDADMVEAAASSAPEASSSASSTAVDAYVLPPLVTKGVHPLLQDAQSGKPNPLLLTHMNSISSRLQFDKWMDEKIAREFAEDAKRKKWEPSEEDKKRWVLYTKDYKAYLAAFNDRKRIMMDMDEPELAPFYMRDMEVPEPTPVSARAIEISERGLPPAPLTDVNPIMTDVWEELKEEREKSGREFYIQRTRLRLTMEQSIIMRERKRRGHTDRISLLTFMNLKNTCNPNVLNEPPRKQEVQPWERFVEQMERLALELYCEQKNKIETLFVLQTERWKAVAKARGIRKGVKTFCKSFPELPHRLVELPPHVEEPLDDSPTTDPNLPSTSSASA